MPARSKRPGRNSVTPDAIRPERGSTAQPQREPRSRARIARGGSIATLGAGGGADSARAMASMGILRIVQNGISSPRSQSIGGLDEEASGSGAKKPAAL